MTLRDPDLKTDAGTPQAIRSLLKAGFQPVFQPIVELGGGHIVAYEALARGTSGSALRTPQQIFSAARRAGLLAEVDQACLLAACRDAEAAGMSRGLSLFANVEPEVIHAEFDVPTRRYLADLPSRLNVFIEVTERSLTARPAELLKRIVLLRETGFHIALDDVGADPRSLALLPLMRPDVIKLDMSLLHRHPNRRAGEVLNGVCAHAEATGARIVAEGVETERDLAAAQAVGATLAQGWYFGRPVPLPVELPSGSRDEIAPVSPVRPRCADPAVIVDGDTEPRTGSKDMLLSMTRALEAHAAKLGVHAVVVAAFEESQYFDEETRRRYAHLAERASLMVGVGANFRDRPAPGVHGAALRAEDPLRHQWVLAVLGPHYAGALVATDLGDDTEEMERRFRFVLTFDRNRVADVAAAVISRLGTG